MSACELGYMYKDVYFSIVYPSKKKKARNYELCLSMLQKTIYDLKMVNDLLMENYMKIYCLKGIKQFYI